MVEIWMDVDAAVTVPVNILPLIAVSDFTTVLDAETYNEAGLELIWNFVTAAGVQTHVAVTPTTGGSYDWVNVGHGIYNIEIPASGGASANNDAEGFGWFTGKATDALPWRGPVIGFRRAALNDLMIDGGTASTNLEDFFDGTGYVGGTIKLASDATLNATQGSYAPAKASDIPSADITAILADTNELQAELVDGGRTDLILDGIEAHVHATDGHVTADYGSTEKAAIDLLDDADGGLADVHTVANGIKAKTDLIPTSPAAIGSAMTLTAAYDATKTAAQASDIPTADITTIKNAVESATYGLSALKVLIDAIKAKSDLIPSNIATALAHLNADIDSRMATFSYTAPSNADIEAIKAITDYLAAMLETDGAVKRYTANALEQAPSGSLTAPTVEEIRAEMDTNSKIANLPSDPADQSAIAAAITAAHATTDALINAITGSGLTAKTYTLTDAITGLPLAGVQVWATTDLAGLNQVDITRTTNDAGQVVFQFNLVAGTTVYIWNRYLATGAAPDTEVV